jgi:hypothetical protein
MGNKCEVVNSNGKCLLLALNFWEFCTLKTFYEYSEWLKCGKGIPNVSNMWNDRPFKFF